MSVLSLKFALRLISFLLLLQTCLASKGQNVGINNTGAQPHASALLDVSSTTKGILAPRVTTAQRTAIASPAQGLLVYDTNVNGFMYYNGTSWATVSGGAGGGVFNVTNGQVHNTGDISTNNFIFGRTALPQSNEGVEDKFMFFQKDKGAFRAGAIVQEDYNWEPDNIGTSSVAMGYNNIASANAAVALGASNIASGSYSTALGYFTKATGDYSTTIGNNSKAYGTCSFAGGFLSRANGQFSIALGDNSTAQSYASMAIGRYNDSITGSSTTAWVETDPLLTVGNGTSNASRRNVLTVLKNGNVGLGTTSPASLFHLKRNSSQGYGHMIIEETGDNEDGSRITYKNSGTNFFWDLYGHPGTDLPAQARFNFNFTNPNPGGMGRDVMTLTGIGMVGIGNTNPSATLDVLSGASGGVPQFRARVNTADYVRMRMANTVATNSYWDIASITSNTTSVAANMNFYYFHNNTGGWNILSLHGNGNATLYGTLTQNSDERLKKNITAIDQPMEALDQLNGYHYNWKDNRRDSAIQTGLLAQEVEKVMPELVKEDEKGIKSVNYNGLIPYLLEAVKELSQENKAMRKEMEKLKK
ncbi:MAG: tail fiber domain-containing protein [Bacteroidota bacterium]